MFGRKKKIDVTVTVREEAPAPPPMGPLERLRLEAWGQAPSGPRSDYPEKK